jgi:hypothetical protein
VARWLVVVVILALALGASVCAAQPGPPVTTRQWESVLNDWLAHGSFNERHSCAAAVVARTHAPPTYTEGTPLVHALDLYEIAVCLSPGDPSVITVGMSNREVANLAGVPVPWQSGPHSWRYRTPGAGRRIVFTSAGYVSEVQGITTGCCA